MFGDIEDGPTKLKFISNFRLMADLSSRKIVLLSVKTNVMPVKVVSPTSVLMIHFTLISGCTIPVWSWNCLFPLQCIPMVIFHCYGYFVCL